jgi:hypothetical protein
MPHIVIANRLTDGLVVFLGESDRWVDFVDQSRLASSEEEGEQLMETAKRAEANQEVIDANLIEVRKEGASITPVRFREAIRAHGPTVRHDLGKQAEE